MTYGQTRALNADPRMVAVMEFLRTNGPSLTLDMRMAGLDVPLGLISRMAHLGLVRKVGRDGRWGDLWGLM